MNKLLSSTACVALCAFWATSCSSMETAQPPQAAAPAAVQAADNHPFNPNADTADMVKNLPTDLPGEIARAHALRVRGDYEDAAKSLGQLMLVAADNAQVVGEYGKVLVQQGRAQDAVGFLKRAVQLSPNDWSLYSAMGVAMDQAGDHAGAKMAYQHALALKPGEPSVMNNLAISRALSGDVTGAKTILGQVSTAADSQPKIKNNIAAIDAMQVQPAKAPAAAPQTPKAPAAQPVKTVIASQKPVAVPATQKAIAAPAPQKVAVNTKATAADEKKLGPNVVMQPVPVDPHAGPVHADATHAPRKLVTGDATSAPAATPKHDEPVKQASAKPAATKDVPPPALRTAADTN